VLAILIGALVLAVPGLRDVGDRIADVNPWWIVAAIVLEVSSCVGFVLAFQHVFSRAPMMLATRIAFSELAFAAILPVGGAGGIAIGAYVVRAKGGSLRRFMERSAVLFLLTSAVNAATLTIAGLLVGIGILHAPHSILLGLVPGLVGISAFVVFGSLPWLAGRYAGHDDAGRLTRWLRTTAQVVTDTIGELRRPTWRLGGAVAYLWCDVAMMWVAFRAFGDPLPIGPMTLAFIIGYLGNILPVPGGIGALDGGLTGALILYGAHPAAAVIVYHAIVLWIPALLGTIAFMRLRRTLSDPLELKPLT
jgi:uncharacterized membrane protein YbhN (UPF0104 family)